VLQVHSSACLRIIGQAPGRRVHETGIPWDDKSGERLRQWLGLAPERFYDAQKVAIIPVAFCYPGKAKFGDRPPRSECAPRWHTQLNAHLSDVRLTLLVGQYAQALYLHRLRKATLTDTVKAWEEYLSLDYLPIVHPSHRNQIWLKKNPWFENKLVPELQRRIQALNL
jgi:uracil-DNA glycosylase